MAGLGFWRIAQANPDWTAVIEEAGGEHKAGDLLARANRSSTGCAPSAWRGDGICGLVPNGVDGLVELYLAALQAGLVLHADQLAPDRTRDRLHRRGQRGQGVLRATSASPTTAWPVAEGAGIDPQRSLHRRRRDRGLPRATAS